MNSVEYLAYPLIVANQRQNNNLKKKWDSQHYQAHRSRVVAAKPEIDNKPPRIFLHQQIQMKKLQMEQERMAVIEKDNRLLLDRIAHIMRTKGCVDNWNECYIKSMNSGKRNRDMVKITAENLAINKRIQEGKSVYDHKKWEKDWQVKRPVKIPSILNSQYSEMKPTKASPTKTMNAKIEVLVNKVMRELISAIDENNKTGDGEELIWDETPLNNRVNTGSDSTLKANTSNNKTFPAGKIRRKGTSSSQVIIATKNSQVKKKPKQVYSL